MHLVGIYILEYFFLLLDTQRPAAFAFCMDPNFIFFLLLDTQRPAAFAFCMDPNFFLLESYKPLVAF